jgi:two-component system sensor histidine kinase YesM
MQPSTWYGKDVILIISIQRWVASKLGRQLIFTYFFIVLLPIVIVAWMGDSFYRANFEKNIGKTTQMALDQLALNMNNYYSGLFLFTDMLRTDSEIQKALTGLSSAQLPLQSFDNIQRMMMVDKKADLLKEQVGVRFLQSAFYLTNGYKTKRFERYNLDIPDLNGQDLNWVKQKLKNRNYAIDFVHNKSLDAMTLYRKLVHVKTGEFIGVIRVTDSLEPIRSIIDKWSDHSSKVIIFNESGALYDPQPNLYSFLDPGIWAEMITAKGNSPNIRVNGGSYQLLSKEFYEGYYVGTIVSYDEYLRPINRIRGIIIGIACFVLVAATAVYAYINWRMVKPISQLITLHRRIKTGDLKVRFQSGREDEIGQLGNSFNQMAGEFEILLNKVLRTQLKEKEAKLKFLHNQIKPHFLYNTLESISMAAIIHRAEPVSQMVGQLGKFYRMMLGKHIDNTVILLRDEVELARCYLDLQHIRFGSKYAVIWDIDENCLDTICLKLIMQPFIENAVFHGLEPKLGTGELRIAIKQVQADHTEPTIVRITIEDDGVGIAKKDLARLRDQLNRISEKETVGIVNVHERIHLYYGDPYGVEIASEFGKGTRITIHFPVETARSLQGETEEVHREGRSS